MEGCKTEFSALSSQIFSTVKLLNVFVVDFNLSQGDWILLSLRVRGWGGEESEVIHGVPSGSKTFAAKFYPLGPNFIEKY